MVYGVDWWDAPVMDLKLWRSTKRDFVDKICSNWKTQQLPATSLATDTVTSAAIQVPQWEVVD
eukprot:7989553-Karenia_brevis.AAC.1